ncbi:hypothetical protein [Streptomyces sp. NPDC002790]|uniref:hypothetical protein n=1 Tax=Streptomyces sp. NPDC002790 TaxID=3154431 RepID=UPI003332D7EE
MTMSSLPAGLTLCHDLTAAAWVREALPDFAAGMIGSLLPAGYERYVRVLHPSGCDEDDDADTDDGPGEGTLPGPLAAPLASVLKGCTATPDDCCFGVWEGCGYFDDGTVTAVLTSGTGISSWRVRPAVDIADAPRLELPHRGYAVFQGPVDSVTALAMVVAGEVGEGAEVANALVPDLWWPADRSWFVHGDTDLTATWIACSATAAEQVLAHQALDAVVMPPDSPVLP